MDANAKTPEDLFGMHIRYVIPPFQRPYVWEEEKQWQPLWEDVARTAELVLDVLDDRNAVSAVPAHFFGAVVLQHVATGTGFIKSCNVIDGQQRLTTLQILIDAVQQVVDSYDLERESEALRDLVLNNPKKVERAEEVFKIWPSRIDQPAFVAAMNDEAEVTEEVQDAQIVLAHQYFHGRAAEWAKEAETPEDTARRLTALTIVLQRHLQLVAIDLSPADNPQMIFESLNDRGTPLLATDLVKNFLFQAIADAGGDVDGWEREYWSDFDEPWWREQVAQGRYNRSRIDIFLQYWLIMRLQEDVPSDEVFRRFRTFALDRDIDSLAAAEELLAELRGDARQFRRFADFTPGSPEGRFYYRIVEALQMGLVTPVLLWLLAERNAVSDASRAGALAALESWVVRRMLLRRTTKDVNRLVVALLKELNEAESGQEGAVTEQFLLGQEADSRYWPADEELVPVIAEARLYNSLQQGRIRMVLEAVEDWKYTAKSEHRPCPRNLQIEHIMPKSWRPHWHAGVADEEGSVSRDRLVNTLGNLTLVTDKLNPSLTNLPWTDEEAAQVKPGAEGKRTQLSWHSQLLLNKELVNLHHDRWTEQDILARGQALAEAIAAIWPRGHSTGQSGLRTG
ncbi:DUF262 domain-containing protein [Crossiella sp. NPDC003009]